MSLKVIQWNLCSFQAQTKHHRLLLSKFNPDVLALQETRFKNQENAQIRNYNCFFKNQHHFYIKAQKKADRLNFTQFLNDNVPFLSGNVDIDSSEIKHKILEAADANIPKKSTMRITKLVPWWNLEARIAVKNYKSYWYFCRQPQHNTPEKRMV